MSNTIKAVDANIGQWYDDGGGVGKAFCFAEEPYRLFVVRIDGEFYIRGTKHFVSLTHLPDCTGWDWQPPKQEPDTSLAASIERIECLQGGDVFAFSEGAEFDAYSDSRLFDEDIDRVIDAAKKWDEIAMKKHLLPSNDPDGVGEGWRLLKDGEAICRGDQFETQGGRWYDTNSSGVIQGSHSAMRRRRRIDA